MQQNDAELKQNKKILTENQQRDKSFSQLKSKISMSNFQMLQLTNNTQKFTDRIFQLNQKGVNSIQSGYYQEASIYLGQAEKLLQYAASCGRAIDREVIIKILNNQALIYQKSWDLQRSISYVQAILFNFKTFLNSQINTKAIDRLKRISQQIKDKQIQSEQIYQFLDDQFDKLKTIIQKRFSLGVYSLQFSTLNSQNQDHFIALQYSKQAIQIFKQTFQISILFIEIKQKINLKYQIESFKLLQQINRIYLPAIQQYQSWIQYVQRLQKLFEKKSYTSSSITFLLQKYSQTQKKQAKYKNFSLANVMELRIQSFGNKILDQSRVGNKEEEFYIDQIENLNTLVYRVLEYSVAFFTLSVQTQQLINQTKNLPNIKGQTNRDQQNKKSQKYAHMVYVVSLKISIELVQQLTQFSRYLYKHFLQIYKSEKIINSTESLSKMDSLKEKYKKYLPGDKYQSEDDQSGADNTIEQYTQNIKISINGKQRSSNQLQKLFKQETSNNSPSNSNHMPPPKLNIDLSEIQSLEYGGSTTFKQNYHNQYVMDKVPQVIQEEYNIKETKKINNLAVRKIITVPNLSDVSSNKSQNSMMSKSSKEKSKSSVTPNKKNVNNKSKSRSKLINTKKNTKSNSTLSKNKVQHRKFLSPKITSRSNYQNQSHPNNHQLSHQNLPQQINDHSQIGKKKRVFVTDKKINSQRKLNLLEVDPDKIKRTKKLQMKHKKKKKIFISPQHSYRNNASSKEQGEKTNRSKRQEQHPNTQNQKVQQKLHQTKKISKLRKAKSFEQPIELFEQLKQLKSKQKALYQTNNIINLKTFKSTAKLQKNTKKKNQNEKTKRQQPLAFAPIKFNKKDKMKRKKIILHPQKNIMNIPQKAINSHSRQSKNGNNMLDPVDISHQPRKSKSIRALDKQSQLNKKKKNSSHIQKQKNSSIGLPSNAIRMSSNANMIKSLHQRNKLSKSKSSKSLFESNFGSGYLLKGIKDNINIETSIVKNGSLVGTTNLKRK